MSLVPAFARKLSRAATIAAAVMLAAAPLAARAQEALSVRVNESTTVELDGNPSTGYRWELDDGASEGGELVKVEDLGYAKRELKPGERPLLGAPSKYQFRVTGLEAGAVKLVFNYVRGRETAPAKTQDVSIEVLGN
jgi:inhibitor of cysteine peptidase